MRARSRGAGERVSERMGPNRSVLTQGFVRELWFDLIFFLGGGVQFHLNYM